MENPARNSLSSFVQCVRGINNPTDGRKIVEPMREYTYPHVSSGYIRHYESAFRDRLRFWGERDGLNEIQFCACFLAHTHARTGTHSHPLGPLLVALLATSAKLYQIRMCECEWGGNPGW